MSDLENSARKFLRRWSERKRVVENQASAVPHLSEEHKEGAPNAVTQYKADLPAFDSVSLPPIESITATSDIRAFLAPGVPEDLARAALRRVWVTDPKIRDFIGIAENQWDFTKLDGVPGFGSLDLTPELRRMVASLVGDLSERATKQQADTNRGNQVAEISGQLPPPAEISASDKGDNRTERSPVRDNLGTYADVGADYVQTIPQDREDKTAVKKSDSDAGEKIRPAYRKHGSALPK
jgi:hypothetical protein